MISDDLQIDVNEEQQPLVGRDALDKQSPEKDYATRLSGTFNPYELSMDPEIGKKPIVFGRSGKFVKYAARIAYWIIYICLVLALISGIVNGVPAAIKNICDLFGIKSYGELWFTYTYFSIFGVSLISTSIIAGKYVANAAPDFLEKNEYAAFKAKPTKEFLCTFQGYTNFYLNVIHKKFIPTMEGVFEEIQQSYLIINEAKESDNSSHRYKHLHLLNDKIYHAEAAFEKAKFLLNHLPNYFNDLHEKEHLKAIRSIRKLCEKVKCYRVRYKVELEEYESLTKKTAKENKPKKEYMHTRRIVSQNFDMQNNTSQLTEKDAKNVKKNDTLTNAKDIKKVSSHQLNIFAKSSSKGASSSLEVLPLENIEKFGSPLSPNLYGKS